MKKLLVVPFMLAALALGTGTANAGASNMGAGNDSPAFSGAVRACAVSGGTWDDMNGGCISQSPNRPAGPIGGAQPCQTPETMIEGCEPLPAAPAPADQYPVNPPVTVPAESYADTFYPAPPVAVPVEPVAVPVEPEPAPVVEPVAEPVPAPVEAEPVPTPESIPEGTEERVSAGEELSSTGVGDAVLVGIAASVLAGGVALVWLVRRMRKA